MLSSLKDDLRYHCPVPKGVGFVELYNKDTCREFMEQDLAKSGLTPELIGAYVTTKMDLSYYGASVAYFIPYFDPFKDRVCRDNDEMVMYRIRMMDGNDKKTGKSVRYTQPSTKQLAPLGYLGVTPYVHPRTMELLEDSDTLYVCEGEKKTACFIHYLDRPAIGIGGYQSWRGEGNELHPWITRLVKEQGIKEVVIIPDGDIYRIDICQGYSGMAYHLDRLGVEVSIVKMPNDLKLDDELVALGVEGEGWLDSLGKLAPEGLVQTPDILQRDYGCSLSKTAQLVSNENNYRRILTDHPAFSGKFELNTDTMDYYHNGEVIDFSVFENRTAAHFQHYFQMHNASPERIMKTVVALCKENQRSFLMDGIPEWDGVERLETMFVDLWGVKDNEVHRELGRKWLTSAYARMAEPGCKVDWMLVTTGEQALGKSYFPEIMFYGLNVNIVGVPKDKDLEMLIHSGLCISFEEMAAMHGTARSREEWKGRMTQTTDSYRPPYERSVMKMPRSCIFYGNTNHSDVVEADEGGNRRWAVLAVEQLLDFETLLGVRDQLWAEAKVQYEQGVAYGQISQIVMDHVAANHTAEDLLYSYIEEFLATCTDGKFYAVDLHSWLDTKDVKIRRSTRELKSVLTTKYKCQYKKVRKGKKNQMGYEIGLWADVGSKY